MWIKYQSEQLSNKQFRGNQLLKEQFFIPTGYQTNQNYQSYSNLDDDQSTDYQCGSNLKNWKHVNQANQMQAVDSIKQNERNHMAQTTYSTQPILRSKLMTSQI